MKNTHGHIKHLDIEQNKLRVTHIFWKTLGISKSNPADCKAIWYQTMSGYMNHFRNYALDERCICVLFFSRVLAYTWSVHILGLVCRWGLRKFLGVINFKGCFKMGVRSITMAFSTVKTREGFEWVFFSISSDAHFPSRFCFSLKLCHTIILPKEFSANRNYVVLEERPRKKSKENPINKLYA